MDLLSICILTYNRPEQLEILLRSLDRLSYGPHEVILVDNSSDDRTQELVARDFPAVTYLKQTENLGAQGRNVGIEAASGSVIITLDDDLIGINDECVRDIVGVFETEPDVGAICFKVVDPKTKAVMDWCHPRRADLYADECFATDDITEGAVAFRKSAVVEAGLYPSDFFLSHEGVDLAIRLMNRGFRVVYDPRIVVEHYRSEQSRESWRRYYYDTRNLLWLVVRNYPLLHGVRYYCVHVLALLVYSLRDGYLKYWLKGVIDGMRHFRKVLADREVMSDDTRRTIREIKRHKPGFWYLVKKRLLQRAVRI